MALTRFLYSPVSFKQPSEQRLWASASKCPGFTLMAMPLMHNIACIIAAIYLQGLLSFILRGTLLCVLMILSH